MEERTQEITVTNQSSRNVDAVNSLRMYVHIVYGCYVASFLLGITAIIGVVLAYAGKNKAVALGNKLFEDHFRWQINTFWWGLVFLVIFVVSFLTIVLPFIIGVIASAWFLYRIIKGWVYFVNNRELYEGEK